VPRGEADRAVPAADTGNVTIQAFYDRELKYGADDVSCIVPVG
jgi:hypothetical protein